MKKIVFYLTLLLSTTVIYAETLSLESGWNLVGVNSSLTLTDLKTKIGLNNLQVIQGQDKTYQKVYVDEGKSFLNDFIEFEEGQGYWIKVTSAVDVKYSRITYTTEQTINLENGWNLINPFTNLNISQVLSQLGDNLEVIQGMDKTYQKTYADENQDFLNDFKNFEEPIGYWVKVANDTILRFPIVNLNVAPTITGIAITTVNIDDSYQFLPTASDGNDDVLIFSIENRPTWATFNSTTGLLAGTPPSGSEGISANVIISVSDGIERVSLAPFNIEVKLFIDTDGDGIANDVDLDDDNDGVFDIDEIAIGTDPLDALSKPLTLSGTIYYERVQPLHNGGGTTLDSNNITQERAKQIVVKLIDSSGVVMASATTDDNGAYSFEKLLPNSNVKVRAYAQMFKDSKWDLKIIDNTNGNAQYVLEGSLVSIGSSNSVRNLTATVITKNSPPFAMLGSVYEAMKKVIDVNNSAIFPPLNVNWSVNNVETGTYYDGNDNIMILGDQNGDSDEYDDHIIIHEWGHYFEEKFSRADSIGGEHGAGETLDIRLAFGEGFGNAWSAIVTDDPIYFDTSKNGGWNMNIESEAQNNAGWFSEASIQRILYDLYDSNDDGLDTLSLGFKPLYDVLVGAQKVTPAFTSLFSFVKELKDENIDEEGAIESIVSSENIVTITDIWGTGRTNRTSSYPYYNLTVGTSVSVETSSSDGLRNKLSNHQYVKFTIATAGDYTIKVLQTNGTSSDPDFSLHQRSPFKYLGVYQGSDAGVEESTVTLSEGNYLLDISDWNNVSTAQFDVTINP